LYVVIVLWAAAVSFGAMQLWRYESTPGTEARAPISWPAHAHIPRQPGLPTLIVLIHPQCPCSRATLGELAKLMTDCNGKLTTTVLILRPAGEPAGWEKTDLWSSAAAIPGVNVQTDDEGAAARLFGAATSGQTLLYAPDGRLLFSGGITESRGHSGDNAGRSAITALVLNRSPLSNVSLVQTPVYGCSLFSGSDAAHQQECNVCRK
jgi:hypothetical protein